MFDANRDPRWYPRVALTKRSTMSNNTSRSHVPWRHGRTRPPASVWTRQTEGRVRLFAPRLSARAPHEAGMSDSPSATVSPAEKVKQFPTTPGVYLMKDAQGRVIYVGKAKNLRSRAGSYFHKTAADDRRICDWIAEVADIEFLAADSEVDALLDGGAADQGHSAQVQPRPQGRQDLSVPADHHRRGLSPRQLHPRAARPRRQALWSVPAGQEPARRDPGLAAHLQVPHLLARHRGRRPALAVVSPLPAPLDQSVHGPVQLADRPRDLPRPTSGASSCSWTARKTSLLKEMEEEMREASKALPVREGRPAPR